MTELPDRRWLLISGAPIQQALWQPLSQRYGLCFLYDGVDDYAASLGVKVENLNRYITADVQEQALTESANFIARVVPAMPAIQARLTARLNGNSPAALLEANQWFPGYLLQHAQRTALMIGAFESFAQTHDLAGCVVHEDVAPDMRTAVALAKAHGLPTIHLPHAPCHLRADGGPDIHRQTRAEWVGVSGSRVRDFYEENGHPADRIAIVGGAQWDGLYDTYMRPTADEARRVLGIERGRVTLWYGATWTQTTALRSGWEKELRAGFQAVLATARRLGAYVIVTLHPNDGGAADAAYLAALKAANVDGLVTRFHLPYIAAAADALIAQGPSNLCIDAAIQGVPACYLRTEGFDYATALPYRSDGEDLTSVVEQTLASRGHPAWQDFVADYNSAHPLGDASATIADWIGEICH